MQNKCQLKNVVYQATVTETTNRQTTTTETYIGICSTTFKLRYGNHKQSFKNRAHKTETELSNHIWAVKDRGSTYDIKWKILDRANTYSPITHICNLCTREKFFLIFKSELCTLNTSNELKSHCRHKKGLLL